MSFTEFPIATEVSSLTASEGVSAIQKAHDMPSASSIEGSVAETNRLSEINPSAEGSSISDISTLFLGGNILTNSTVNTIEYHDGTGIGGNKYIAKDAGSSEDRPDEDGGRIIHVGDNGLYFYGLFTDGLFRLSQFGGGRGNQPEDTAALQSMIDLGLSHCFLEDSENYYEFLGYTVPSQSRFKIIGQSLYGTKIAVRGKIGSYGSLSATTNIGKPFENLTFTILDDARDGVVEFNFCRNIVITDIFVTDNGTGRNIGFFAKLDRSYQVEFKNIVGTWYGGAMYELDDSTGLEVLDTIKNTNTVWHGNYGVFIRSNSLNVHNVVMDSAKWRDKTGSDENTNANIGKTYLTGAVSTDGLVINVTDSSVLKQGNLAANDFLYVGYGTNAEVVRVASISSNEIIIDPTTPLRFNHSIGDPVIFGAVYLTADSVYSFTILSAHFERGLHGIHANELRGANIVSMFSTCKQTICITGAARNWNLAGVTMGNVGFGSVDLFEVPSYHDSSRPIQNININSNVEADTGVTVTLVNNNSSQSTDSGFSYKANGQQRVGRSLTTTINTSLISSAVIYMIGRIDTLNLQDGLIEGQQLEINFVSDSNGYRYVSAFSSNVTLSKPLVLSYKPNARDKLTLEWRGDEWVDIDRIIDDYSSPRLVTGDITSTSHDVNAHNKEYGKVIRHSGTGNLLYADGPLATDPWIDSSGTVIFTPS